VDADSEGMVKKSANLRGPGVNCSQIAIAVTSIALKPLFSSDFIRPKLT